MDRGPLFCPRAPLVLQRKCYQTRSPSQTSWSRAQVTTAISGQVGACSCPLPSTSWSVSGCSPQALVGVSGQEPGLARSSYQDGSSSREQTHPTSLLPPPVLVTEHLWLSFSHFCSEQLLSGQSSGASVVSEPESSLSSWCSSALCQVCSGVVGEGC